MDLTNMPEIPLIHNFTIYSTAGPFKMKELKGQGVYGSVVRCKDKETKEKVAVKIHNPGMYDVGKHEEDLLRMLKPVSDSKNIVKIIDSFTYMGRHCCVLEHLDISLYEGLKNKRVPISDIRCITEQLLVAFKELGKRDLVHADLKPDNVMIVNRKKTPLKVKLIDFGWATTAGSLAPGQSLQARIYRAPEVFIGNKVDAAIDMWSLGCVMAFMYLGDHLFHYRCKCEMMRAIVRICGMPDEEQLQTGRFTDKFFIQDQGKWQLKTLEELKCTEEAHNVTFKHFTCLEDMMASRPLPQWVGCCHVCHQKEKEEETLQYFDLLHQLLQVNPAKRITAAKALHHPFIMQKSKPKMSLTKYLFSIICPCLQDVEKLDLQNSSSSSDSTSTFDKQGQ